MWTLSLMAFLPENPASLQPARLSGARDAGGKARDVNAQNRGRGISARLWEMVRRTTAEPHPNVITGRLDNVESINTERRCDTGATNTTTSSAVLIPTNPTTTPTSPPLITTAANTHPPQTIIIPTTNTIITANTTITPANTTTVITANTPVTNPTLPSSA
ncbi:unnamed protein product [Arctogadus glacialis]